jgi:Mn2+/Fe2+ NRAMP family transporter
VNGVIAVPIMAIMMKMAARPDIMGKFVIEGALQRLGWIATGIMALAAVAMIASSI